MKLFGFPGTRSNRIQWVLEEAQIPYEYVKVNLLEGAHKRPEHMARHPHGYVPVLEDGGLTLIESAAMCMHVADMKNVLAPAIGTPERARYYQFVVYAVAVLDENVIPLYFHMHLLPEAKRQKPIVERCLPIWAQSAAYLEKQLGQGPWLLGSEFTVADVAVGYDLTLAAQIGLLSDQPGLREYAGRLADRPAFKKVFG
jgi:glutathione S-transferase